MWRCGGHFDGGKPSYVLMQNGDLEPISSEVFFDFQIVGVIQKNETHF